MNSFFKRLALFIIHLFAQLHAEEIPIYSDVDIRNPSMEDLLKIQNYLLSAERPILSRLCDTEFIPRNFRMIGERPKEVPIYTWLAVNSPQTQRENCIICYASFNERYPRGCARLLRKIAVSDFRGHIHIRIGGWPGIENGDLALAHVPFAFKPCFFKEMQRQGYKRVLWIDSSIIPVVSLNKIFNIIKKKGYFAQKNSHDLSPFMNEDTAHAFGLSLEEANALWSCSAAIIGIDFTDPTASQLVETWYEFAKDPYAYYSPRSDQTAISILFHQFKMTDWAEANTLGSLNAVKPYTLFIMDRSYVKDF